MEVDVLGALREVDIRVRKAVEVRVFDNGHRTHSEVIGRGSRDLGNDSGTCHR